MNYHVSRNTILHHSSKFSAKKIRNNSSTSKTFWGEKPLLFTSILGVLNLAEVLKCLHRTLSNFAMETIYLRSKSKGLSKEVSRRKRAENPKGPNVSSRLVTPSLKLTAKAPVRKAILKGKDCLPTIRFQSANC